MQFQSDPSSLGLSDENISRSFTTSLKPEGSYSWSTKFNWNLQSAMCVYGVCVCIVCVCVFVSYEARQFSSAAQRRLYMGILWT